MNTGKTLFAQLIDFLPPDQRRTSVKKIGGLPQERLRAWSAGDHGMKQTRQHLAQPAGLLPPCHCEASHGFKSATPVAWKSATLRVTIVMP